MNGSGDPDRYLWITLRRALLMICTAIAVRYSLDQDTTIENSPAPPAKAAHHL